MLEIKREHLWILTILVHVKITAIIITLIIIFDGPWKTQELINLLRFLDFHMISLIWWNLWSKIYLTLLNADKAKNILEIKREHLWILTILVHVKTAATNVTCS